MKFSTNNFFSKCDQIRRSGLVTFTEEILYEKFIFYAVLILFYRINECQNFVEQTLKIHKSWKKNKKCETNDYWKFLSKKFKNWYVANTGVPQGSIQSPLLLLVYINNISTGLSSNPKVFKLQLILLFFQLFVIEIN